MTLPPPQEKTAFAKIGFVGLGRMGANMARRLHEVGFPMTAVYDLDRSVAATIATELAAQPVSSLAEVTRLADVIITVVSDDAAMEAIYQNPADNLLSGATGKLFINCATISPQTHRDLFTAITAAGADVLECPMASSIPQARAGTLFLMCAGLIETYERALPILNALSQNHRYVGEAGRAAEIKALVNMVMNMNTAALAEGLGLADALGLNLTLVREIFASTGANSRVLETDGEDMQAREHSVYFSAAHAAKDSGIALSLARQYQLPLPLAEATLSQYQALCAVGLGELDKSAVSELTFLSRRPRTLAKNAATASPTSH
ncbi:MAG: NAD(P)-dependent oxidoreductase [Cyanobacteria bacterium]|nr:NAD(P)-dependent oxidoreductase [Cyanobacteriota bacterium]